MNNYTKNLAQRGQTRDKLGTKIVITHVRCDKMGQNLSLHNSKKLDNMCKICAKMTHYS